MIEDLDETIRQLILTRGLFDADSIEVSFDQPTGDWAASLTRPTVNCYLYDIRENMELRSAERMVEHQASRRATRRLAPLRYDLSYLITVWTQNQVEDEHAIIWRVLSVLARHSPLPKELLHGQVRHQPYPIRTRAAQRSMAIQNLPDLWGVMENQLRPSVDFVATVAMDREAVEAGPLVLTKRMYIRHMDGTDAVAEEILQIAGIVHRGEKERQPVGNAIVTLVDAGRSVRTDRYGRYSFANVAPGDVQVRVSIDGSSVEQTLTIPSTDHDAAHYDIALG